LIVAPAVAALRVNKAVPEEPVVDVGAPPHLVIVPAMPPQIPNSATFWSWNTMLLFVVSNTDGDSGEGQGEEAYAVVSVHVVPVMAFGSTFVLARRARTSKCSCRTATEGNGIAETLAEAVRRRVMILTVYILFERVGD
jgi:hypothetical protein